jgi:hypothetical protein
VVSGSNSLRRVCSIAIHKTAGGAAPAFSLLGARYAR